MWPVDPESEEPPSEKLLSSSEATLMAMSTPTVAAIATPMMNAADVRTGLEMVTKMIADMICGPSNIVMARGRIARFMISSQYTAAMFRWLQRIVSCAGAVADRDGHPGDAPGFLR